MRRSAVLAMMLPIVVLAVMASLLIALFSSQVGQAAQLAADYTTGLISCWDMSEQSGVRYDAFGPNHLTDNNTVGFSGFGISGPAAFFVAANSEWLSHVDNADLSFSGSNDAFSLYIWVKPVSSAAYGLVGKTGGTQATTEYRVTVNASRQVTFLLGDGTTTVYSIQDATNKLTTGVWNHIVAIYEPGASSGKMSLYVNNNTPTQNNSQPAVLDSTNDLTIGSGTAGYTDGSIDQVVLFDNASTSPVRSFLWNSGYGRSCADLIATGYQSTSTPTVTPTSTPDPRVTQVPLTGGGALQINRTIDYGQVSIVVAVAIVGIVLLIYVILKLQLGGR